MSIWDDLDFLSYEGDDDGYMENFNTRSDWITGFTQGHTDWRGKSYNQNGQYDFDWFVKPPLDELVEQLATLSQDSRSVERVEYDADNFKATAKRSNTLKGVAKKGSLIDERFPTLVEDTFNIFYKGHPFLVGDDKLDDFGVFAKSIVKTILEHPKFSGLRTTTKWSELFSAWATRSLADLFDKVSDHAPEPDPTGDLPYPNGDPNEEQSRTDDSGEGEEGEEEGEADSGQEGTEGEGEGEASGDGSSEGTEASGEDGSGDGGSSGKDGSYEVSEEAKEAIAQAVDEYMDEAMDEVAEAQRTQHSWGLEEGSGLDVSQEDVDVILNLLASHEDCKKITEMVGRVQSILDGVETESEAQDGAIPTGYALGDMIAKASPTDLAMLRHPQLKADVFRRASEGGLQIMERTAPESMGQGPIIALVDGSGSMSNWHPKNSYEYPEGTNCRTPLNWATAMAISLFRKASDNGQPFILHKFSSITLSFRYDNPVKEYSEFLKQIMSVEDGGTELAEPLLRASQSLKEYPEADVVILSDAVVSHRFGDKDFEPVRNFREAVELSESKAIGVLIADREMPQEGLGPLEFEEALNEIKSHQEDRMKPYEALCDIAFQIDIADPDAVNNITEQVFKEVVNE